MKGFKIFFSTTGPIQDKLDKKQHRGNGFQVCFLGSYFENEHRNVMKKKREKFATTDNGQIVIRNIRFRLAKWNISR